MERGRNGRQLREGSGRWLLAAVLDPIVWVFLLSGTFEVLTGDPTLHATLLFTVAAVLLGDAIRRKAKGLGPVLAVEGAPAGGLLAGPDGVSPRRLGWAGIVAGVLFAVAVGSMRRYTYPVTLTVWLVGAPALVWAWRVPPRHRAGKPLPGAGLVAWVAAFVGLAIWELIALSFQPSLSIGSANHPTFSTLTNPLFAHPAGRVILLALWLALGWYLVER